MTLQGRGGWSFAAVALWAGIGVIAMLYIGMYKTVFSSDHIRQYGFLRRPREYPYDAIEQVRIGEGKGRNTIVLTLSDGTWLRVYGTDYSLLRAQALLRLKLPHLATV
jgi:hypothetical protein